MLCALHTCTIFSISSIENLEQAACKKFFGLNLSWNFLSISLILDVGTLNMDVIAFKYLIP